VLFGTPLVYAAQFTETLKLLLVRGTDYRTNFIIIHGFLSWDVILGSDAHWKKAFMIFTRVFYSNSALNRYQLFFRVFFVSLEEMIQTSRFISVPQQLRATVSTSAPTVFP
jgi:hypothetical protein